jgi:hypothetical protein
MCGILAFFRRVRRIFSVRPSLTDTLAHRYDPVNHRRNEFTNDNANSATNESEELRGIDRLSRRSTGRDGNARSLKRKMKFVRITKNFAEGSR